MKSNFVPGINSCLKVIKSNVEIKKIYINKVELVSNKRMQLIVSNKIIKMAQNHVLRDDFAKKSIQRRDDFFDWDEYAKRLIILYHKIINGHI